MAILASLPSRWALAGYLRNFGFRPAELSFTGVCVDVRDALFASAVVAVAVAAVLAATWLRGRRDRLAWTVPVVAGCLPFPLWLLGWSAATEFKIQRGLYPTWVDAVLAARDA